VLTIIKGAGGINISENAAFNAALAAFKAGEKTAVLHAQYLPAEEISISDIYDSVYCQPRSAEFDKNFNILPGENGLSFDLELARAEYDAAENGSVVAIPLIETEPEYTDEALASLLFRDKLGSWTSKLTSNETRSKNIELAAAEVNGVVIMPGEDFSFNDTVGERTTSRGFGAAPAYIGGQTVDQVGGGICQVSSSIYYCCLYADLEILYRTCHLYAASYIPLGMDATVSWGGPDFKFRNNMDYPVKIVAWRDGGELFCELYGTKTTDEYIEMTYEVTNTYNYGVVYREDASVSSGQTKTDVSGITGYKVKTYKARYKGDGTLISRELEATSNYSSRDRVILVAPGELYLYDPSVPAPGSEAESGEEEPAEPETSAPVDAPAEAPSETPDAPPEASSEPVGGDTEPGEEAPAQDESLPDSELIEDGAEPAL
jgi:vancomycin resistance protein YoaR